MTSINSPNRLMLRVTIHIIREETPKNSFLINYLYSLHNAYHILPSNRQHSAMYMAAYFQNVFISSRRLEPKVHKQLLSYTKQ